MCRKNHLHGCCCLFFGLGLIVGHCVSSWFVCCCGGIALLALGFLHYAKKMTFVCHKLVRR